MLRRPPTNALSSGYWPPRAGSASGWPFSVWTVGAGWSIQPVSRHIAARSAVQGQVTADDRDTL
ncbi:hypothetical protein BMW24_004525 [Mycobacterium heckeshornense]|uniref:Uncharacterized protein n=1 Tax=Mycobacterium heckeshornense TaxID=110505 RepID=A0A2G8BGP6_9MYCO|nr:hypothetical protein ACT16_17750 [Mycobacterium heckeshornense]PIJ36963.1 hypothetical protein BMW24_004525 [Mycobacterium heckeshornense]BCO35257.1 hypothetical protein MHEC_16900 [Mycobacterium heckeshornense]